MERVALWDGISAVATHPAYTHPAMYRIIVPEAAPGSTAKRHANGGVTVEVS